MDPQHGKASHTSSEAILDSLFDTIAKSEVNVSELLSTVTVAVASEKLVNSDGQPVASMDKDAAEEATIGKNETGKPKGVQNDRREGTSQPVVVGKKTSRTKITSIKIASLKETTKSKIIESTDQARKREEARKSDEEGEILPSDTDTHDLQSDDDQFEIVDESDGELAASDNEEKSSKKHRKKNKKRKKHEHRHKKRKRSREDRHGKTHHEESVNSSKLLEESPKSARNMEAPMSERRNDPDRRPWKNMLNFHLNLDQRRGHYHRSSRNHISDSLSRSRRFADDYRSESQSRPYYSDRSRSPLISRTSGGSAGLNCEWHRPYPPNQYREYSRNFSARSTSFQSRASGRQWSNRSDFRDEQSVMRSRSRSRRRSSSKERSAQGLTDKLEKESCKSPVKENVGEERIDKQKLYEIARRNAAAMLKSGALQKQLSTMSTEDLMKLRSGGKSVEELIAYCQKIQKKETRRDADASSSDEGESKNDNDGDELDEFVRHPFLLKQQTSSFVFNVKNVTQIPVKTPAERAADDSKLRVTFPVSSGEQHRKTESEWVPVPPPTAEKSKGPKATKSSTLAIEGKTPMLALPPPPSPPVLSIIPPPPPPPVEPIEREPIDIGEVVNTRLKAIKRLNDNSNDVEAMKMFHFAEEQLKRWAESKNIPGLFTGSTGAECLTPDQLAPSDYRFHAWTKKDYLTSAKPVSSGVGMQLLQKMGWRPGEGLGKNREGTLEPLLLQIKSDRKGLLATEEGPSQRIRASTVAMKDFQGKHPVSALMELCSKRRWGLPSFSCVEAGPSHDRRFTWKAIVNGVEYQTATPSSNKKAGKAQVCQVVLQSLGLVPRDKSLPVVIG